VIKTRGTSGKHIGKPPYRYRHDPQDKDHWIPDEDAAPEKQSTKRIQKVRIIFNFMDEFDMPEISEPVIMETTYGHRKTA